ncbi:MAG: class I poly(R)-hydroxyalkanoic acid synthase, partial [Hydrogenophaga sp.]|nr:class I poly(R)-hydroxyalkanoic acid synthase [Hydrogenophaga sp.]
MTSGKTPPTNWLESAQQFQQNIISQWTQLAQAMPGAATGATNPFGMPVPTSMPMPSAMPGMGGIGDMFSQAAGQGVSFDPAKLLEIQNDYLKEVAGLWNQGPNVKPAADRRFASDAWAGNPVAAFAAASYLLNARTLMAMADAVQGDAKTRSRVRFAVQQWIDASAPSNFLAFNAEAQKKAIDTQGESIAKGVANLLHDMKQGHVSMTDESVFEV